MTDTIDRCPECSGCLTTSKGNIVCSDCGLIIDSCVIVDEMTYEMSLDHTPLWSDKQASKIRTQKWIQSNQEWYKIAHRIHVRFKKQCKTGYHHCCKCGLQVLNTAQENHVCNFNSTRNAGNWHKVARELLLSGKTVEEVSNQLGQKIKAVQAVLYDKKNNLPRGVGSGYTKCKNCGATISSLHGKKTHVCGIPEDEKHVAKIDDSILCYLSYLGDCGGKYKKRLAISGKSIAEELKIKYFNHKRYPDSILSQLNDPRRFIVCCARHAEKIKILRAHHKWNFDKIIEIIEETTMHSHHSYAMHS